MRLETKQTESFSSILFTAKIPVLKRTFRIHLMLFKSPDTWVLGYSSKTLNGRHVLFFDFDSLEEEVLGEEIKYLQDKFRLSDFYVFKTSKNNGWHAVCLDCHSMQETYSILKDSSADQSFIHSLKNLPHREYCLRLGSKGERLAPEFFKVFESNNYSCIRSSGHADLLKKLGVPIKNENKGKWDGYKKVSIIKYNTANRVRKEDD
jgi:hypothetical protein